MSRQLVLELVGKGDKLSKALGDATKQTESFGDKVKGASLKAGAGITAVGVGLNALGGPLKDSQVRLGAVAKNIDGLDFEQLDKDLGAVRSSMQRSGHSISETNNSMSKLLASTGSEEQALKALAVADELAAFKGISLESATDQVNRAMAGGKRVTNELGIALEEGADPLDAMMDKLEGTSKALESTIQGRMSAGVVIAKDFAASIGAKVGPALTVLGPALMAVGPAMTAASAATGVLRGALTLLAAHPILLAIMAGGAIIVALVMLEKKFGIVSKAVAGVKDAAVVVWDFIKTLPGKLWDLAGTVKDAILWPYKTAFNLIAKLWNNTVGQLSFQVPGWVPGLGGKGFSMPKLPTFALGGVVAGAPGTPQMVVAHGGEEFLGVGANRRSGAGERPIIINVAGSVITERDLSRVVADAFRDGQLLGIQ